MHLIKPKTMSLMKRKVMTINLKKKTSKKKNQNKRKAKIANLRVKIQKIMEEQPKKHQKKQVQRN
jgi:hypothetical protein